MVVIKQQVNATMPLRDLFAEYGQWGDWEEADLMECVTYLRCSSLVDVPPEYKDLIPKSTAKGM